MLSFHPARHENQLYREDVSTCIWGGGARSSERAPHMNCEGVCAEDEKQHNI